MCLAWPGGGYCACTTWNRKGIVDCWVTRRPQTWPLSAGTGLHNRGCWPSLSVASQQLFVFCYMANELCALNYVDELRVMLGFELV